jgi:hypothetical protein
MPELDLDKILETLHRKFTFLWQEYSFKVTYLTSSYDMYYHRFTLCLENDLCKLVFEQDSDPRDRLIRKYIGGKSSLIPSLSQGYYSSVGWHSVSGLIFWMTGIQYESLKDLDQDLDNTSQYMKLHMDSLLDLYRDPETFEEKMEYYRNLHRKSRITVDQIKEERARLKALGQDWSLEAAMVSLRGCEK